MQDALPSETAVLDERPMDAAPDSPAGTLNLGVPPAAWQTTSRWDPIRYYQPEDEGTSSWEYCLKFAMRKDPDALESEWMKRRLELERWLEAAEAAVATGDADAGNAHPCGWKASPYFSLHLLVPPLFVLGRLSMEEAESVMEQGRRALVLSVRLHVQELMYWKREGAYNLRDHIVHAEQAVKEAAAAGLNGDEIPEVPQVATCREEWNRCLEEISKRIPRSEPIRSERRIVG